MEGDSMKEEKSEVISFRISQRYKQYLDLILRQSGVGITEYFTNLLRADVKRHVPDVTLFSVLEDVSKEYGFPAATGYALMLDNHIYIDEKIEAGIIPQEKLKEFREKVNILYSERLYTTKKEFGLLDDILKATT
jgi:hypothetical protein